MSAHQDKEMKEYADFFHKIGFSQRQIYIACREMELGCSFGLAMESAIKCDDASQMAVNSMIATIKKSVDEHLATHYVK